MVFLLLCTDSIFRHLWALVQNAMLPKVSLWNHTESSILGEKASRLIQDLKGLCGLQTTTVQHTVPTTTCNFALETLSPLCKFYSVDEYLQQAECLWEPLYYACKILQVCKSEVKNLLCHDSNKTIFPPLPVSLIT